MPLKANKKIEYKLQRALDHVHALTSPEHPRLDPKLHAQADALRIYIASWIEPELEQALAEMRGEKRVEDWKR